MPYLPTPQAYLEQSALLLQAYPDSRITTKYSFPSQRPSAIKKSEAHAQKQQQKTQDDPSSQQQQQPQPQSQSQSQSTTTTTTPAGPVATLILKTYNPAAGICLKYRTNKAAEVGRLVTSLGKLAGGADVASLGLSSAAPGAGAGDVEMTDAPAGTEESAPAAGGGKADTGAKGGKSKKKGKGKR